MADCMKGTEGREVERCREERGRRWKEKEGEERWAEWERLARELRDGEEMNVIV